MVTRFQYIEKKWGLYFLNITVDHESYIYSRLYRSYAINNISLDHMM